MLVCKGISTEDITTKSKKKVQAIIGVAHCKTLMLL